jgi:pyrophosphatase PpaX
MTQSIHPPATRIKGILFDNDGTLVDTHDLILASMRYSTKHVLGCVIPDEDLMRKVGQPLAVQMVDFTSDPAEQEEILRVYREHNHAIHDDAVRAFPGAREALAELAAHGVKMGVVTSKMHALAWRGLEITGLAPYLDCCIGADDCERFKPEAEPVERGLRALGLEPSDCLYVGDSPFDIQAGAAAGCGTVAITWGMFSAEELAAQRPTYTCATFEELVDTAGLARSVTGVI